MVLKELKARPFLLLVFGLLVGLSFPSLSWIAGAVAVVCWFLTLRPGALVAAGAFLAFLLTWIHQPPPGFEPGAFEGEVLVTSYPQFVAGREYQQVSSGEAAGRMLIVEQTTFAPRTRIAVTGTVTPSGNLKPSVLAVVDSNPVMDAISSAQASFGARIDQRFGARDGSWVRALALNDPSGLSKVDKDRLVYSGTYHLVSASGMHVWVLAVFLHYVLIQIGLPRHWQIGVISVLLLGYCLLTEFHAPTVRATLMWLIASSAYLIRRVPDGLSALCISALLWLSFAPGDAATPGFQLSYLVSGCLLAWFEKRRHDGASEIRSGVETSLVASIAAEPLAAWWFGRIVFVGPIANLLVGLSSSVVMILGFASLLPVVGSVFALVAKPLLWWTQTVVEITGRAPALLVKTQALPPIVFAFYYLLLLIILLGIRPKPLDPLAQ